MSPGQAACRLSGLRPAALLGWEKVWSGRSLGQQVVHLYRVRGLLAHRIGQPELMARGYKFGELVWVERWPPRSGTGKVTWDRELLRVGEVVSWREKRAGAGTFGDPRVQ